MNTNTEIFEQLNSYFQPNQSENEKTLNLSADHYRRLYEWQDKRVTAYVRVIGGLLGGMNAIVESLEKNTIDREILLKIIRKMSMDAHDGFEQARDISIEK
jgi:hypothetical protein